MEREFQADHIFRSCGRSIPKQLKDVYQNWINIVLCFTICVLLAIVEGICKVCRLRVCQKSVRQVNCCWTAKVTVTASHHIPSVSRKQGGFRTACHLNDAMPGHQHGAGTIIGTSPAHEPSTSINTCTSCQSVRRLASLRSDGWSTD